MPSLPTTPAPTDASALVLPGAMFDKSHGGIISVRAHKQVGWSFRLKWPPLSVRTPADAELMAFADYIWSRKPSLTVLHPMVPGSGMPPNGLGSSGVTVAGAGQTGGTIDLTGFPTGTSNVVRAGDVLKFAGDDGVYKAWASANSDGSGNATISIVPNLRLSPANGAAVTTTGVPFTVICVGRSEYDQVTGATHFADFTLQFSEFLNT